MATPKFHTNLITKYVKFRVVLLKFLMLITIAVIFFVYGLSVMRYKIFPYYELRNIIVFNSQTLQRSVNIRNTALQRLYITKVYLNDDKSYGGALVAIRNDVLIVDRMGSMVGFDFSNYVQLRFDVPEIPMGTDLLKSAGWNVRDNFDPNKFRVMGGYAVTKGNNEADLYIFHHYFNGSCFDARLSRISLSKENNLISAHNHWEEIFRTRPCLYPDEDMLNIEGRDYKRWIFAGHVSGGGIIRYDENNLLISVGDYFYDGYDRPIYAQDESKAYGKFILINIHNGENRIFAKGTRNAQGLYKDKNGNIWSTDHAPQGGDELNIISDGKNYGWPLETYGIQYNNSPWPISDDQGRHDRFTGPVFAWARSIAPSDLIRIEKNKFKIWSGDLIVTTLNGRALHRLRPSSDVSAILYDEKIDIGHRIRNILTLHDGSLLLRTDDNYLIHVDDAGPVYEDFSYSNFLRDNEIARRFTDFIGDLQDSDNIDNGALVFNTSCTVCHAIGGASLIGPNLEDLSGRKAGSLPDYKYSEVMKETNMIWDENLLRDFLKSPQSVFSGTAQPQLNLSDKEIELLIDYLLNDDRHTE